MFKYNNYQAISQTYTYLWSKYRPAVLKLMVAADGGPQQYQFSDHEFRNINPKEKGGYAFTLQVFRGKAVNGKTSPPAQGLLLILQQSRTATALAEISTYEFKLDKHFVLHVLKQEKLEEVTSLQMAADQPISEV